MAGDPIRDALEDFLNQPSSGGRGSADPVAAALDEFLGAPAAGPEPVTTFPPSTPEIRQAELARTLQEPSPPTVVAQDPGLIARGIRSARRIFGGPGPSAVEAPRQGSAEVLEPPPSQAEIRATPPGSGPIAVPPAVAPSPAGPALTTLGQRTAVRPPAVTGPVVPPSAATTGPVATWERARQGPKLTPIEAAEAMRATGATVPVTPETPVPEALMERLHPRVDLEQNIARPTPAIEWLRETWSPPSAGPARQAAAEQMLQLKERLDRDDQAIEAENQALTQMIAGLRARQAGLSTPAAAAAFQAEVEDYEIRVAQLRQRIGAHETVGRRLDAAIGRLEETERRERTPESWLEVAATALKAAAMSPVRGAQRGLSGIWNLSPGPDILGTAELRFGDPVRVGRGVSDVLSAALTLHPVTAPYMAAGAGVAAGAGAALRKSAPEVADEVVIPPGLLLLSIRRVLAWTELPGTLSEAEVRAMRETPMRADEALETIAFLAGARYVGPRVAQATRWAAALPKVMERGAATRQAKADLEARTVEGRLYPTPAEADLARTRAQAEPANVAAEAEILRNRRMEALAREVEADMRAEGATLAPSTLQAFALGLETPAAFTAVDLSAARILVRRMERDREVLLSGPEAATLLQALDAKTPPPPAVLPQIRRGEPGRVIATSLGAPSVPPKYVHPSLGPLQLVRVVTEDTALEAYRGLRSGDVIEASDGGRFTITQNPEGLVALDLKTGEQFYFPPEEAGRLVDVAILRRVPRPSGPAQMDLRPRPSEAKPPAAESTRTEPPPSPPPISPPLPPEPAPPPSEPAPPPTGPMPPPLGPTPSVSPTAAVGLGAAATPLPPELQAKLDRLRRRAAPAAPEPFQPAAGPRPPTERPPPPAAAPSLRPPAVSPRPPLTKQRVEQALVDAEGDYLGAAEILAGSDQPLNLLNAANQARHLSPAFNEAMGKRPRTGAQLRAEWQRRQTALRGFSIDSDEDLVRFVRDQGGIRRAPDDDLLGEWEAIPAGLKARGKAGLTPSAMAEKINEVVGSEAINDAALLRRLQKSPVKGEVAAQARQADQEAEAERAQRAAEVEAFLALPEEEQITRLTDLTDASPEDIRALLEGARARRAEREAPFAPVAPPEPLEQFRSALSEAFLRAPEADPDEIAARVIGEFGGNEAVRRDLFGGNQAALGAFLVETAERARQDARFMEERPKLPGGQPSLAPGMVRLYRGEGDGQRALVPEWVTQGRRATGIEDATGRWFTDDPEIARWYAREAGPRGRLVYVDLPEREAEAARIGTAAAPEVRRRSRDPQHEFFLPPSVARRAAPLVAQPRFEPTPLGDQALIPGTEGRRVPETRLRAPGPQKPVEETPLFEQERRRREGEAQPPLFQETRVQGDPGALGGGEESRTRPAGALPEQPARLPARLGGPAPVQRGRARLAPIRWRGWQERSRGEPLDLWDLTEDIPGHVVGSTLVGDTLRDEGFSVPAPPEEPDGTPFKYSTAEVRVPVGLADALRRFAQDIPQDRLAEKGLEDVPHVTLRYGLHLRRPDRLAAALQGQGPFRIDLGALGVFPDTPDGDALYVRVESPELAALHEHLTEALRVTETQAGYRPHITLAYLKPGAGAEYVGDRTFAGRSFEAEAIVFGPKDGSEPTVIPLRQRALPAGQIEPPPPAFQEERPIVGLREALSAPPPRPLPNRFAEERPAYGAPAPAFFSALRRAAEQKLPARATAQQIMGTLRGAQGVKTDEIKWSYLEDWLAEQTGPVVKADLLAYLDDYGVKVRESLRGGAVSAEDVGRHRAFINAFRMSGPRPVGDDAEDQRVRAFIRVYNDRVFVRVYNYRAGSQPRAVWRHGPYSIVKVEPLETAEALSRLEERYATLEAEREPLWQRVHRARTHVELFESNEAAARAQARLDAIDTEQNAVATDISNVTRREAPVYFTLRRSRTPSLDPAHPLVMVGDPVTDFDEAIQQAWGDQEGGHPEEVPRAEYEGYKAVLGGQHYRELLFIFERPRPLAARRGQPTSVKPGYGGWYVWDAQGRPYGVYEGADEAEALAIARRRGPTDWAPHAGRPIDLAMARARLEEGNRQGRPSAMQVVVVGATDDEANDYVFILNDPASLIDRRSVYLQDVEAGRAQLHEYVSIHRPETFRAPHFQNAEDMIAHVRFDERSDAQGRRGVLIQEVQDDLDNQIRKKTDRLKEAEKELAARGTEELTDSWKQEIAEIKREIARLEALLPFRGGKSNELVMKRMLRWASEHGYEWLGLATGAQQATLYGLSQHIDAVEYEPSEGGGYTLRVYLRGQNISDRIGGAQSGLTTEQVEEMLGPSVTRRIEQGFGTAIPMASITQDFLARGRPVGVFRFAPPPAFFAAESEVIEARRVLTPLLRAENNLGFDSTSEALAGLLIGGNWEMSSELRQGVNRWVQARRVYDRFLQAEGGGSDRAYWRIRYENGLSMGVWLTEQDARREMTNQQRHWEHLQMAAPSRRLEGLDLDVDSLQAAGKKKAYDEILPAILNKLAKPWGIRIRDIEVDATDRGHGDLNPSRRTRYEGPERPITDVEALLQRSRGAGNTRVSPYTGAPLTFAIERTHVTTVADGLLRRMRAGSSFAEAMGAIGSQDLREIFGGELIPYSEFQRATVHALSITPEMRASPPSFPLMEERPRYGEMPPELQQATARLYDRDRWRREPSLLREERPAFGADLPARAEPTPRFYSVLRRAAATRLPPKAPANQVLGILRSTQGVKTTEIHWTGLEGWLAGRQGSIPKAEVLEFLRANEVRVSVRELSGEPAGEYTAAGWRRGWDTQSREPDADWLAEERASRGDENWEPADEDLEYLASGPQGYAAYGSDAWMGWTVLDPEGEEIASTNTLAQAVERAHEHYEEGRGHGGPRHHELVEPGGVPGTYRERLFVWPPETNATEEFNELRRRLQDLAAPVAREDVRRLSARRLSAARLRELIEQGREASVQAEADAILARFREIESRNQTLYEPPSAHFEQPNLIAHSRLINGTLVDGTPVLRGEEFQSDWRHAVLSQGERGPEPPALLTELPEGYTVGQRAVYAKKDADGILEFHEATGRLAYVKMLPGGTRRTVWSRGGLDWAKLDAYMKPETVQELRVGPPDQDGRRRWVGDRFERTRSKEWLVRQPDGVRITGHTSRVEAIKKAVEIVNRDRREAWEIAVPAFPWLKTWYDLVLKDALMEAARTGKGWLVWTTGTQQAERWSLNHRVSQLAYADGHLQAWGAGRLPTHTPDVEEEVAPKDLPGYVGAALAERLIAANGDVVSGQDLQVGGIEHRVIYDQLFMQAARALAKPWKARVEDVQVMRGPVPQIDIDRTPDGHYEITAPADVAPRLFRTRRQAEEAAKGLRTPPTMTMHGVEITEEMRRSVLETGLPIMEPRPGFGASEVDQAVRAAQAQPVREGEDATATSGLRERAIRESAEAAQLALPFAQARQRGTVGQPRVRVDRPRRRAAGIRGTKRAPGLRPEEYHPLTVPSGVEVLGLGIVGEIAQTGRAQLIGRKIADLGGLALAAQPMRNPLFEVLGILWTKRGRVIDHDFASARLPNATDLFSGRIVKDVQGQPTGEVIFDKPADMQRLRMKKARLGADGYILMHNHPSGDPTPSLADHAYSAGFQAFLPGFQGHLVINAKSYAWISPGRLDRIVTHAVAERRGGSFGSQSDWEARRPMPTRSRLGKREAFVVMPFAEIRDLPSAPEPWLVPAIANPWLGQKALSPLPLAIAGRAIRRSAERSVTLFHLDNQGGIRVVENVVPALLSTPAKADSYITARQRATGTSMTLAYLDRNEADQVPVGRLVDDNILVDAIVGNRGGSVRERRGGAPAKRRGGAPARAGFTPTWRRRMERGAMPFGEERPPFDASTEADLRALGRYFYERIPNYEAWGVAMRQHIPAAYHHLLPEVFDHLVRAARPEMTGPPPPPVYGERGQRLAGNLNLDKYESGEDVRQHMEQVQRDHAAEFERQRRGIQPDVEVRRVALELGVTEQELRRATPGQAWSAEKILATRFVLAEAAERLNALRALSARPEASAEDMGRFVEGLDRYQAVAKALAGMTAEAGRALRQFRQTVGPGQAALEDWQSLIEQMGGPEATREAAELLGRLPAGQMATLTRFTRDLRKNKSRLGRAHDKFYEYWINARLSGLTTLARNFAGSLFYGTERALIDRALAAGIDLVRASFTGTPRERFLGEVLAETYALPIALLEAKSAFLEAWTTERPVFGRGREPIFERPPSIPGKLGRATRIPTRAMLATDEGFKALGYRMALHAEAYRQAAREGLSGEARWQRAMDLAADPPDALMEAARLEAHVRTFTDNPPDWVKRLIHLRDDTVIFKYILPFIRTPQRIFSAAYQRSPLYLIELAMREFNYRQELADAMVALRAPGTQLPLEAATGGAGGGTGAPPPPGGVTGPAEPLDEGEIRRAAERLVKTKPLRGGALSDKLAKNAFGMILGAGAVLLVLLDWLTGNGPDDRGELAAKRATGWRPYSVYLPFYGYVSYRGLEPFSTIIGSWADMIETGRDEVRGKRIEWMARLFGSIAKVIEDKDFLKGLGDLAQAYHDPGRYMQRWTQEQATSLIPNIATQAGSALDPTVRRAETVGGAYKAKTPIASFWARPQRDLWGRPVRRDVVQRFSRLLGSEIVAEVDDPGARELVRLHMGIRRPGRTVDGIELNEIEYERYQEMAGLASKHRVAGLTEDERARFEVLFGRPAHRIIPALERSDYQRAADDRQIEKIEDVIRFARAEARARLLREIPWAEKRARRQKGKEEKLHPDILYRLREGEPKTQPDVEPVESE